MSDLVQLYPNPEQVGQHSPGKGETILSGGHVAVRGQTLWWQLRRPFVQVQISHGSLPNLKLSPSLYCLPWYEQVGQAGQHWPGTDTALSPQAEKHFFC